MESNRNKIFIVFISCVFVIFCVELGLQLRQVAHQHQMLSNVSASASMKRILIVGDSVMGDQSSTRSLSYKLKNLFEKKMKNFVQILNISEPALSSFAAVNKIDKVIQDFKPDIAIVMLGNSDYVVYTDSDKTVQPAYLKWDQFFSHSVLYKLIKRHFFKTMIYDQNPLKQRRGQHTSLDLQPLNPELIKGYEKCLMNEKNIENCAKVKADESNYSRSLFFLSQYFESIKNEEKSYQINQKILQLAEIDPSVLTSLFWKKNRNQHSEEALKIYELYLKFNKKPSRLMSLQAKYLYHITNQQEQGRTVFQSLVEKEESPVFKNFYSHLMNTFLVKNQPDGPTEISPAYLFKNRDDYISALYAFKVLKKPAEAKAAFAQLELVPSFEDNLIDQQNYRTLVEKLMTNGSFVYTLQYPNQPIWIFDFLSENQYKTLKIIDVHNILMRQSKDTAIYDLFEDDFMHMSEIGNDLVSQTLVEQISKDFGNF